MHDENTSKEETQPLFIEIMHYFVDHPAIGGSFIYIVCSFIGSTYSFFLYRKFQINIFDYAEASDFLLIAFKEPYSSLLIFVTLCITFILITFIVGAIKALRGHPQKSFEKFFSFFFQIMGVVFILYTPYYNAKTRAKKIIRGESTINVFYQVGKHGSTSIVKKRNSSLIGSTEKFMFIYDRSDNSTIAISKTQIISIKTNVKP